jgi:hypothetical protein
MVMRIGLNSRETAQSLEQASACLLIGVAFHRLNGRLTKALHFFWAGPKGRAERGSEGGEVIGRKDPPGFAWQNKIALAADHI